MTPHRLDDLLDGFPACRVAVVGDFFLDKYLDIDPSLAEPSVETGKTAHQVAAVRTSPGAAGTVVNNLSALGTGTIHAIGAIGDDGEGYDLRRGLEARGASTAGLMASPALMTPTYLKPRDRTVAGLAGEHERYDTKNRQPTPPDVVQRVIAALDSVLGDLDAVIVADQVVEPECGVVTARLRGELADRARSRGNVVFWADSRARIHEFRRVITKPNQFEAVGRTWPSPGEVVPLDALRQAVAGLRARSGAPVCATCGERGAVVSDEELSLVPGVRLDGPIDPTGAGDSVTAGAVLALAAGATLAEAALVGVLAASITVQQLGTTGTATREQLAGRLPAWRRQQGLSAS
ncbi:MAG TPA: PfkB family carbohydrate kinase [Planctomycetaceae bacterium]|nr:PfkB family carbohydrate kinase [Planctomycetaceae bacterium]